MVCCIIFKFPFKAEEDVSASKLLNVINFLEYADLYTNTDDRKAINSLIGFLHSRDRMVLLAILQCNVAIGDDPDLRMVHNKLVLRFARNRSNLDDHDITSYKSIKQTFLHHLSLLEVLPISNKIVLSQVKYLIAKLKDWGSAKYRTTDESVVATKLINILSVWQCHEDFQDDMLKHALYKRIIVSILHWFKNHKFGVTYMNHLVAITYAYLIKNEMRDKYNLS